MDEHLLKVGNEMKRLISLKWYSRLVPHMLHGQVMNFLDFHLLNHGFVRVMQLFFIYPMAHYRFVCSASLYCF